MAYAKVHVACVIRASGYKKSSKNISNPNFNLQKKITKKMGYIWDFCKLALRAWVD